MNRKLFVSALGALLLASSHAALAEGGAIERSLHQVRTDQRWHGDGDRRDWRHDRRSWHGHGPHHGPKQFHGRGHYKPYWHHRYPHRHHHYRHHGGWRPHGYDRDGVTIIFRGSFY